MEPAMIFTKLEQYYFVTVAMILFMLLLLYYFIGKDARDEDFKKSEFREIISRYSLIIGPILIFIGVWMVTYPDYTIYTQINPWYNEEGYLALDSVYINFSYFLRTIIGISFLLIGVSLILSKIHKVKRDE